MPGGFEQARHLRDLAGEVSMPIAILSAARWPVLGLLTLTQIAGASPLRQEPHRPIPFSLLEEHAEVRMALQAAVEAGGAIAPAAREVLTLIDLHMAREQQLALAPLRLLPRLASGEMTPDMTAMIAVTDHLRAELPALRKEHVAIRRALEVLWEVAWRENRPEYAFVAQRINRHISIDEEVLFPAAILVGDYLRLAGERAAKPTTE
jgi:hypothetical protein